MKLAVPQPAAQVAIEVAAATSAAAAAGPEEQHQELREHLASEQTHLALANGPAARVRPI